MNSNPKTIFKYQDYTTQNLQNLKSNIIYFGSPLNFNDPYDCAISASITEPSEKELLEIRDLQLHNTDLSLNQKSQIINLPLKEFGMQVLKGISLALKGTVDKFLNENGVSCFSEQKDNLLMWSHYGGQFKGFCLEFRTEFEPFDEIKKVKYVEMMPQLNLYAIIVENKLDSVISDLFCTKSESWSYEKEWRGLHKKSGTSFHYQNEALKAIYFGPKINPNAMEIICLILGGQNPNVELWFGERSKTEFKVNFTKKNYMSYTEAKKRGLRK